MNLEVENLIHKHQQFEFQNLLVLFSLYLNYFLRSNLYHCILQFHQLLEIQF